MLIAKFGADRFVRIPTTKGIHQEAKLDEILNDFQKGGNLFSF